MPMIATIVKRIAVAARLWRASPPPAPRRWPKRWMDFKLLLRQSRGTLKSDVHPLRSPPTSTTSWVIPG
jgi:hypothetical protein